VHEYSIVQALYDAVAAQATERRATGVHEVRVRIGELSGVDTGLLETAWETYRVHTMCASAPLTIERVAARWVCRSCGAAAARGGVLRCEPCGAPLRLAEGDEIVLDRIVMEVP
jgi:hydrogenase nickel insertion protein HypA